MASRSATLRNLLAEQFGSSPGCEALVCGLGGEALDLLQGEVIDIVVAEDGLPDLRPADFLEAARRDGFRGPVIRLVAGDPTDALEPAADLPPCERLAKPFSMALLLARVRTLVRAFEASEEAAVPIGPFLFQPGAKLLINPQGERLKLTEKETAILRHLHRAGSATVVTRDELLQDVFGYNAGVETHTLETHVYRLRQKIESDPAAARILLTEPGGYRLQP